MLARATSPHAASAYLPSKVVNELYKFSASIEDVRSYGEQSGDLNPLHFDDYVARKRGITGLISDDILFNDWFTRLLKNEFSRAGEIYPRNSRTYLAPIYPNQPYAMRVSTPRHAPPVAPAACWRNCFSSIGATPPSHTPTY